MTPAEFRRIDEAADEIFYEPARLTVHLDDAAVAAIGEIYESRLPESGVILDLMSSWRSHIPSSVNPAQLIGLGLNRAEMEDNPALTGIVIHNLNREPRMPFDDGLFDGAVLTVSVQYLTRPIETFADVGRVLKARAPFVVAFSNRMFPTKAVAIWVNSSESERIDLVENYFVDSGMFDGIEIIKKTRRSGPPSDPVYVVSGKRVR